MKTYLFALSTFLGTIIGVGLFGLPYVAYKSGFFITLGYFVVITIILLLLHLMYGELSLQEKGSHQFPGYVERFLGKPWKKYALLMIVLAINGGLLAYLIIGGKFLFQLFSPFFGGSLLFYQIIFYLSGAFLVYKGLHSVAKTEFFMLALFLTLIFIFFFISLSKLNLTSFVTLHFENIFFPYGVVVFSLWGLDIVPTLKDYLTKQPTLFKTVIVHGILLSAVTYIIFIIAVLGVTGSTTTQDAITGLLPFFNTKILFGAYIFGVLTTFTSFIALGLALKRSFQSDYNVPHEMSWFFAMFPPIALLSLGLTNFLTIINITGAIMLGVEGLLISLMYLKLIKQKDFSSKLSLSIPPGLVYCFALLLLVGIVSEIFFTIIRQ
jgi:amino acid permease